MTCLVTLMFMIFASNHNMSLLADKLFDFLRQFYKFELCHVFPCGFSDGY